MAEQSEAAAARAEKKKARIYPTVLVAIPGWPPQDPGRRMIYWVRPNEAKANKMAKRLQRQMPEYEWSWSNLTAAQTREIERAPFVAGDGLMVDRVAVRWTGRVWKMEPTTES